MFRRFLLTYSRYARRNGQNLSSLSHRFAIEHPSPTGSQGPGSGLHSRKNLLIVREMHSRQHGQPGLFLISNLLTGLLLRPARI